MIFDMITRMLPKKKKSNSATIAGAISLAALSGALFSWYATRKMRDDRNYEFLSDHDEESQP